MGVEIERRFLVKEQLLPQLYRGKLVHQGYLIHEPVVRVRHIVDYKHVKLGYITLKGKGLAERPEYEVSIHHKAAKKMLKNNISGAVVCKRRFEWKGKDGKKWEIDFFQHALEGLIIAEIELPKLDCKFEHPEWLGAEITNIAELSNSSLSKIGAEWRNFIPN